MKYTVWAFGQEFPADTKEQAIEAAKAQMVFFEVFGDTRPVIVYEDGEIIEVI